MDIKNLEGKSVFIETKTGRKYSGLVEEVSDFGNGLIFISITDKFNMWVTLALNDISVIEEEVEDGRRKA